MGTMIHLAVGNLEIDWGKNYGFSDHSALYQAGDVQDVVYYGYIEPSSGEDWVPVCEKKPGLSKPLRDVIPRVDLLGHSERYARLEFTYLSRINHFDKKRFTYDQMEQAVASVDVTKIPLDYGDGGEDFGKFFRRQILPRLGLAEIVQDEEYDWFSASEGMENLSPYTVLRMLAKNPSASGLPVTWNFADLEEAGWGTRETFVKPLDSSKQFLIVTEGNTDAIILQHALRLFRPNIADFFTFVDMEEGYPFTGTGNLHNFTKGLISIAVQNNIVILYDNDAAGVASFRRTSNLRLPANMRVLKLPDLMELSEVATIGPTGEASMDINGRAASIEAYLDLGEPPAIRWTSFNQEIGEYHGEPVAKKEVMKRFLRLEVGDTEYTSAKIERVLDTIINACIEMREAELIAEIENDFRFREGEEDLD